MSDHFHHGELFTVERFLKIRVNLYCMDNLLGQQNGCCRNVTLNCKTQRAFYFVRDLMAMLFFYVGPL